ncbi:MAG: hypothetical protein JNG84_08750 [Archangium sp.]|nr:hypothetical protein [Archangium sp.]
MKVEDSTLVAVRAFERMGVKHYVTGSLASSLHGEPRATNDADVVAVLRPEHFTRLNDELKNRFFLDEDDFVAAASNERSFNLIDEVELAKVDVFCVRADGYQAEALTRTVRLELERDDPFSAVEVASPEDVIISKLRWYRLGGDVSDRQWRDVVGVLSAQHGRLDLLYVRRWCQHFQLEDLFERAVSQVDDPLRR